MTMLKPEEGDNFFFLLAGLLLMLFIGPAASYFLSVTWGWLVDAAFVSLLVLGVWSLARQRVWFRLGVGIGLAYCLSASVSRFTGSEGWHFIALLCVVAFWVLSMAMAMRQVVASRAITLNNITGSVCVYLLLGLIWAALYYLLERHAPGSINGVGDIEPRLLFWRLTYYSFVTLTTLGYGDMSPAIPLAEVLVYIEAIVGQFYIAIMVASLVGVYISDRMSGKL